MKNTKLLKSEAINQARHDFDEIFIKMSQDENIKCGVEADIYLQKKYFYYEEMAKLLSYINDIKHHQADRLNEKQMQDKGIKEYLSHYKELLKSPEVVNAMETIKKS